MTRPTKQGIDYFPIDCQFDDKIELYILEKESNGLSVLVTLWQLIYQNEGYYIVNNKDLHLLIKKRINVDINTVNECINVCIDRNIFDKNLHKKYQILTSKAIQKRFFYAAKRKKSVDYDVNYLINGVSAYNNGVNVVHQSTYVKGKGKGKGLMHTLIPLKGKGKEEGKGEKKKVFVLPDWIDQSTWASYEEMRENKKAKMSDSIRQSVVDRLEEFRKHGLDVDKILKNSIISNWTGVFKEKGESDAKDNRTSKREPIKKAETKPSYIPGRPTVITIED